VTWAFSFATICSQGYIRILSIRINVAIVRGDICRWLCRGSRLDGSRSDVDAFGGSNDPFLLTRDCDLVHNLTLVQWNVGDDIGSTAFSLTPLSGGLR
jgi:hypothetical protein